MSPGQAEHGPAAPLLGHQEEEQRRLVGGIANGGGGETDPWLAVIGLLFLTFNSVVAIYRSDGDAWSVAFVLFSYSDLVALFACLRVYERAAEGSPLRHRLKVVVWLLTSLLTAAFSYKVAAFMPILVALLIYVMAFATVAGGYYVFFLLGEK